MTVDQQDLANAAKKLQVLYEELDHAKYERPPAPEVSTQGANQQKGPSEPFPIWTISDDAHFTALLNEYCDDAARYVPLDGDIYTHGFQRNGARMCQWIAWNAGPISQLDVAPLMLDELNHQARELNHRLRRTRPLEPIGKQEAWLTARTICYRLKQQGHDITPELLRQWAQRGKITVKSNENRKNLYSMTQILSTIKLPR
ncbi:hypothetical protein [Corynebacterium rhinophilum]|uniref:hypothetical protein n=1 Tax=Corynebacterium rhinophilum TaxID=3050197 RepID=UPI00254DD30D|nr:hypothetical protein [Corynebacterium sp. MSK192]MDK8698409.1 hypothetical protein [Corynebacterium sp. MSK192]